MTSKKLVDLYMDGRCEHGCTCTMNLTHCRPLNLERTCKRRMIAKRRFQAFSSRQFLEEKIQQIKKKRILQILRREFGKLFNSFPTLKTILKRLEKDNSFTNLLFIIQIIFSWSRLSPHGRKVNMGGTRAIKLTHCVGAV